MKFYPIMCNNSQKSLGSLTDLTCVTIDYLKKLFYIIAAELDSNLNK